MGDLGAKFGTTIRGLYKKCLKPYKNRLFVQQDFTHMHSPQIGQQQKKVESYLLYRDFQISGDLGVEVRTPIRELHEDLS